MCLGLSKKLRTRRLLQGLMLSACAVAVVLAIGEIGVRIADPIGERELPDVGGYQSYQKLSNESTFVEVERDGRKLLTISPARLRDFRPDSLTHPKPPDTRRIFCMGGSCVYGLDVSAERT